MRIFSVLLAITAITHAAPSDPGAAALDFLEKVRERKINLEPGGGTALSSQTADEKKHQISLRLDRLAKDLGTDPLEVGEVKQDEDYAAVLVRKDGGFDPSRLQVFPVAVIRRGAEWLAAPVPASFENTGAGYAITLKKRLERLETWMLREQVVDLEKLREQAAAIMRRNIETHLTAKDLRSLNADQAAARFIAACARKDLPTVLGFLGGLATTLPDDWLARLKAADQALAPQATMSRPWRLLSSPEVLRVIVEQGGGESHVPLTLACLDPAGSGAEDTPPRIETVRLELIKNQDDLWQVNLPREFLTDDDAADDSDDPPDVASLNAFAKRWREDHPVAPQASPELAEKALVDALSASDLQPILRISNLGNDPESARDASIQAAQLWWLFHAPTAVRQAMPLDFKTDADTAAATFQLFSSREPDRLDLRTFYFEKSGDGWLWLPVPHAEVRGKFKDWTDSQAKSWPEKWQETLLAATPVISKSDALPPPSKEEAKQCLESWFAAIHSGDPQSALRWVTRLDDPSSPSTTLRNLGYEILGARRNDADPQITGIYEGRTWTAVGVKAGPAGKATYPLYPVIRTPLGPRILLEIDLFAAGSRAREFLNRAAIGRLEKHSSSEALAELRNLYAEHQKQAESSR